MSKAITHDNWTLERKDGTPVCIGETLTTHRDETYVITGGRPPHKPSSTGRVWVEGGGEYFPSVFDLRWVEFVPATLPDSVPRTPATQEMYLDSGGIRCPFCGSEAIYTGNTHLHTGCLDQEIHCDECHTSWYDQYTLTGYKTISKE
jgi:hypothetical protein